MHNFAHIVINLSSPINNINNKIDQSSPEYAERSKSSFSRPGPCACIQYRKREEEIHQLS